MEYNYAALKDQLEDAALKDQLEEQVGLCF